MTIAAGQCGHGASCADLDGLLVQRPRQRIREFTRRGKSRPAIRPLKQEVVGNVGDVLWVVMGTIGVVMLIACANVANLLLVRAEARQQELALRAALGAGVDANRPRTAGRKRAAGSDGRRAGRGLAYAGLRLLVAIGPANLPRLSEISLDARTLAFTLVLSLLSGFFFGLIPALKYAGPRISAPLCRARANGECEPGAASRAQYRWWSLKWRWRWCCW